MAHSISRHNEYPCSLMDIEANGTAAVQSPQTAWPSSIMRGGAVSSGAFLDGAQPHAELLEPGPDYGAADPIYPE
jgi:hypothetical protein